MSIEAITTPQSVSFGEGEQQKQSSGKGGAVLGSAVVGGAGGFATGYFLKKKVDAPYIQGLANDKFDKSGVKEADPTVYEEIKKHRESHSKAGEQVDVDLKAKYGEGTTEVDVAKYLEKEGVKKADGNVATTKADVETLITEKTNGTAGLQTTVNEKTDAFNKAVEGDAKNVAKGEKEAAELALNNHTKELKALENHKKLIEGASEGKIKIESIKAPKVEAKQAEATEGIVKSLAKIAEEKMPKFNSMKKAGIYAAIGAVALGLLAAIFAGKKKPEQQQPV